jgi:uncharacterized protein
MKISLVRVPVEGLRFAHQYQLDELDVSEHEFVLREPPQIEGRIRQSGMDVHLTGNLKASVVVPCDRCLQAVSFEFEQPLKLVYVPVEAEPMSKGETELHEGDLEFSSFENHEIDLDQLIREQLELALPTRVLCQEACRGLCAQCGADLNVETCQCTAPVYPRWQVLAELRNEPEQND